MKKQKQQETPAQIQLELPDYSQMYYEYMKQKEEKKQPQETVIIVDIY